jgi:hypothetical protein
LNLIHQIYFVNVASRGKKIEKCNLNFSFPSWAFIMRLRYWEDKISDLLSGTTPSILNHSRCEVTPAGVRYRVWFLL